MKDFDKFFGKKLCVAVSGGVDSTALLHYLKAREKDCGYTLSAVHCEHGIRGKESLADAEFVKDICLKWNVPLITFFEDCPKRAKTEKTSLETAARNFRKACFQDLITSGKADYIATAHHQSDEAETVLFRLARGSSLSGASGMRREDGFIIRPFLEKSKAEILRYASENQIPYHDDSTNFEPCATRNKLRLQVLPALENAVDGAIVNLARFAELAAQDDELLYELSRPLLCLQEDRAVVSFCDKEPLFRRACLTAMKYLGVEKDYTAAHLQSLTALQKSERGALLHLPCGVIAEKTVDGICFYLKAGEETLPPEPKVWQAFSETGFDGGRYEVSVTISSATQEENEWKELRLDADTLPQNAVFRFRKDGDEIRTFGGGTKTLKKFFNEKKIPVKERAYLPLIAEKDGKEVFAICGVEISERVKITETTQRALYINLRKK